jgi:hypothetical protein
MSRALALVALLLAVVAHAEEPRKLKGSKKESAPKLDLGIPSFGEIPKDQKLESAKGKEETKQGAPSGTRAEEGFSVVRVVHGKGFIKGPDGAKPSAPFPQVAASGPPWMTEKFSSVIRVKNPAKKGARIEVAILDTRDDTVMEASGEIFFRGTSDETEWQVDWDSSGIRNPGEFKLLVRVGGTPLGTFPFKVAPAAN